MRTLSRAKGLEAAASPHSVSLNSHGAPFASQLSGTAVDCLDTATWSWTSGDASQAGRLTDAISYPRRSTPKSTF